MGGTSSSRLSGLTERRCRCGNAARVSRTRPKRGSKPLTFAAVRDGRRYRQLRCAVLLLISPAAMGQTQPVTQTSDQSDLSATADFFCRGRSGGLCRPPSFIILYPKTLTACRSRATRYGGHLGHRDKRSIRLGDGNWENLDSWRLFDEVYFPVCAPNTIRTQRASSRLTI